MEGTGEPPTFDALWRRVFANVAAWKRLPRFLRWAAATTLRRRSLPLRDLQPDAIVELAGRGQAALALVGGSAIEADPAEVLALVDEPTLVGPAVMYLRSPSVDDEVRSTALYDTIVLDQVAGNPHRLRAALLIVWHVASRLRLEHQRGVLDRCVTLATQPIDPYEPQPITFAARAAAAALLHSTTTLDDRYVERLRERGPSAPDLLTILAVALQRRSRERGSAMTRALRAAGADADDARAFAGAADVRFSPADPVRAEANTRTTAAARAAVTGAGALAAARLPIVTSLLAGPILLGAAWVASWVLPHPPKPMVGSGQAFGALGLLVAVHVVAAELAADRLRGIVARHTSTPWPLLAGESMAVTLLFVAGSEWPHDTDARKWIAVVLVASLVLSLLLTLSRLVARTDPVAAVKAFSRARRTSAIRAGRELGRIHRGAAEAAEAVAALGWVRTTMTEPRVLRRERVVADKRGFLAVSAPNLRRLGTKARWRDEELRLLVADQIGAPVNPGREVMSIVPAEAATVSARDTDDVRRCLEIKRLAGLDALTEAVGGLTGLIVVLDESFHGLLG